jgi:hypothetical protein
LGDFSAPAYSRHFSMRFLKEKTLKRKSEKILHWARNGNMVNFI